MKKIITILFVLGMSYNMLGQTFVREKPEYVGIQSRIHLYGMFQLDNDGLYYYNDYGMEKPIAPDVYLKQSTGKEQFFAYDKKNDRFYFHSNNVIGYYNPTKLGSLDYHKKNAKENKLPIVTLENARHIIGLVKTEMKEEYDKRNDSILEVKRQKLEQEKNDSIEAARRKEAKNNEYRKHNNWHELSFDQNVGLYCNYCNDYHRDNDLYVISINSDTIYYLRNNPELLIMGNAFHELHFGKISHEIKERKKFQDYIEIWRDSIGLNDKINNDEARTINTGRYKQYISEISKVAPYGFVGNWGWHLNTADGVEPYFTFFNMSNKTIKYIDFHFCLFNAVGDRCYLRYNRSYTGSVRGVGPVESFSYGSWNWDRATHYTTADASEMRITKIVITYMDKTVKTLTGNAIVYE